MAPAKLKRTTYYTLRQAAALLTERGTSTDHKALSRAVASGKLKGEKIGEAPNAPVLVEVKELERYAKALKK